MMRSKELKTSRSILMIILRSILMLILSTIFSLLFSSECVAGSPRKPDYGYGSLTDSPRTAAMQEPVTPRTRCTSQTFYHLALAEEIKISRFAPLRLFLSMWLSCSMLCCSLPLHNLDLVLLFSCTSRLLISPVTQTSISIMVVRVCRVSP